MVQEGLQCAASGLRAAADQLHTETLQGQSQLLCLSALLIMLRTSFITGAMPPKWKLPVFIDSDAENQHFAPL